MAPLYGDKLCYRVVKLLDHPKENLYQYFDVMCDFIRQGSKEGGVLVHCYAGLSRSTTAVCAYLMRDGFMTLAEALKLCRDKRPNSNPNEGFYNQLNQWELELKSRDKSSGKWPSFISKDYSSGVAASYEFYL